VKLTKLFIFVLSLLTLSSCATITPNFSVKQDFWNDKTKVIGVAIGDMPNPTTHKSGSQGLLDMAINNANAGDLETHLNSLDVSKINNVADKITAYLKGKGLRVKRISERVDIESLKEVEAQNDDAKKVYYGSRDYSPLKNKYGIDKIVLINIVRIGTIRNYYGFIPLGAPKGLSHLGGYIINLDTNQLEWKQSVVQTAPNAGGEWDTPPNFDGLTDSMYTAFNQSRNMLFNYFSQ